MLSLSYLLFDKYCQAEWQSEDIDILLTEGTGHD
jgi:hypothetical protein